MDIVGGGAEGGRWMVRAAAARLVGVVGGALLRSTGCTACGGTFGGSDAGCRRDTGPYIAMPARLAASRPWDLWVSGFVTRGSTVPCRRDDPTGRSPSNGQRLGCATPSALPGQPYHVATGWNVRREVLREANAKSSARCKKRAGFIRRTVRVQVCSSACSCRPGVRPGHPSTMTHAARARRLTRERVPRTSPSADAPLRIAAKCVKARTELRAGSVRLSSDGRPPAPRQHPETPSTSARRRRSAARTPGMGRSPTCGRGSRHCRLNRCTGGFEATPRGEIDEG